MSLRSSPQFEFAVFFIFTRGTFECDELCLDPHQIFLARLGFWCLQALGHGLLQFGCDVGGDGAFVIGIRRFTVDPHVQQKSMATAHFE